MECALWGLGRLRVLVLGFSMIMYHGALVLGFREQAAAEGTLHPLQAFIAPSCRL